MTMRERIHDGRERPATPGVPLGGGEALARAAEVQARGADAIARALSQDSVAFLAANKQEGGQ